MFAVFISILEKIGLGLLGQFFATTANTARDSGIDSTVLDYLFQLVSSAEANSQLVDGNAKYDWVFGQAVQYLNANGINLAITFLESLIQLAVHHQHTTSGAAGSTVASVAAKAS